MELNLHLYFPYLILWRLQQQILLPFFHDCFIPFLYTFRTRTPTYLPFFLPYFFPIPSNFPPYHNLLYSKMRCFFTGTLPPRHASSEGANINQTLKN